MPDRTRPPTLHRANGSAIRALPLSDTEIAPYVLAVGDVNGDGKLDAATPNLSSNTVSLFLGVGDGTFMQQRTFPTDLSPRAVAIADS